MISPFTNEILANFPFMNLTIGIISIIMRPFRLRQLAYPLADDPFAFSHIYFRLAPSHGFAHSRFNPCPPSGCHLNGTQVRHWIIAVWNPQKYILSVVFRLPFSQSFSHPFWDTLCQITGVGKCLHVSIANSFLTMQIGIP